MSDAPLNLELRLLPDWLKEPAGENPYANYEGETQRRPSRNFQSGGGPRNSGRPQGGRDGGRGPRDSRDSRGGPGGGNRPNRNSPRDSQRPQGQGQDNRQGRGPGNFAGKDSRPGGQGASASADNRQRSNPRNDRQRSPKSPQNSQGDRAPRPERTEPEVVIPLQVDFIPEANGIAALVQQIKSGHRAFPLYGMGRMFLNKPERHRVRITSNAPAYPLFQIGENGSVTLNRVHAERDAFRTLRNEFYVEETQEVEAPKGNFTNVARCRLSGVLLGPTNHHGYQPALRRLYDARFSRRMDFQEFLRQIEVLNTPEAIEQWKKESSTVTVFRTLKEETPVEFKSLAEVEAHFRTHYLPGAVTAQKTVEISGEASRSVGDRRIRDAIRDAWEKERGFPAQIVNGIKPHFTQAGLQIWKHKKRILFVSVTRPVRFGSEARNVSEQIANILNVIETSAKCSKNDLSLKLLKPFEADPEFAKIKSSLASDLHWLIESGHVIEFHDGILDLPLAPKEAAESSKGAKEAAAVAVEDTATPAEESTDAIEEEVSAPSEETPAVDVESKAEEEVVAAEETAVAVQEEVKPVEETGASEESSLS